MSSRYGFVVMAWRQSAWQGAVVLALTVAQLAADTATHPRSGRPSGAVRGTSR